MRLLPRSLRLRVSALLLVLLALLFALLFVAVDVALSHGLRTDLSGRLSDRARLAQQLDAEGLSSRQLVDRVAGIGIDARVCSQSSCTSSSGVPSAVPQPPGAGAPGGRGKVAGPGGAQQQTVGSSVLEAVRLSDGRVLELRADATYVHDTIRQLVLAEILGGLLALVVAGVLLSRTVGFALRPLDDMTRVARDISRGDRGRRLAGTGAQGELGRTADAFDEMLDAVQASEANARAAEERMRQLLADAAHELRTPVAGARAAAEQLLRNDPPREERERLAVAVVRQSERAARLVQDLLDMARIDGGLVLQRRPVELTRLVAEQIDLLRTRVPAATVDVVARPVWAEVDRPRIGQVLSNLLDNAVRAAGPHGHVTVRVAAEEAGSTIDVHDTGPGVPAAERERIFDRLVRLDEGRGRAGGGAGLGLPIARGIARAHGGDVRCLPAETGGWFRVTVPAARRPADRTPEIGAGLSSPGTLSPAPAGRW